MRKALWAGLLAAGLGLAVAAAQAETIRIANHGQAGIDAMKATVAVIEKKYGVTVEVVEYPSPDKDYVTKLLTELGAGNGPDIFSVPSTSFVADMAAAGYLAPIGKELKAWEGYDHLYDVAKHLAVSPDGETYVLPSMLGIQQIYFRRDVLEKAGISTEQPKTWQELIDRAKEIKAKTGQYGLLFPAGISWGSGAFEEGFQHLLVGSKTPQLATADGKLDLSGEGIRDVFDVYKQLIDNDLMPIQPLLGPEPWVIPKYEMFPAGKVVATTCGSWCYIFDWGRESKNPIPNVEKVVGTWTIPGQNGGQFVLANLAAPWAVNAKAANVELAKKVLFEIGSLPTEVSYAAHIGNIPARKDAAADPEFQKLTELVPIHAAADKGVFLKQAAGFSAVSEGVGRATEALLRKQTDAAGAQKILIDYVKEVLGDDAVK
ncbi:ABC transporter substrate-binding protein [Labrys wisconsinensis]|uniref:Multiple sugar transport system substrate-binding protein n=1 Tax=Labrys wisconsinensis TaxID=425677 RepID=A0ABU0J9M8_9HYPH|nr:extracellular solute-binding protein [Labrys wisconsinensis]MDQ0470980.1 multiple sugar transport system substrate-binding protein [Labrys wisconsinensis]